jgi:acetyl-CoA carboxylase biotin carboxyl carrier protein
MPVSFPSSPDPEIDMAQILSPLPGTFYRSSSPDTPPFKVDGDDVTAGDVIGLIEVMKSFHEVKAEISGKNIRFAAENEDPVMAGAPLADVD